MLPRTDDEQWSRATVRLTQDALRPVADRARAQAMRAYMKDIAPFFGVATPQRVAALRPVWKSVGPAPSSAALSHACVALFALDEREFHYAAIDLLGRNTKVMDGAFLRDVVEPLIRTKSWWDTVDSLRSAAVGPLVARHPNLLAVVHRWAASDDRWLVRSAIIHQLGYHEKTDVSLLFDLCRMHAHQTEFFIAKGIGWALREYSYVDPEAVEQFVAATPLRPLSQREALKAINRRHSRGEDAGGQNART